MPFTNFTQIHQSLRNSRVAVLGNLNMDLIIRGVAGMPKWGQEVIGVEHVLVSSGQAGYLAFALRGLDIPTAVTGNVGGDLFGRQIVQDLQACGVGTRGIEVSAGLPTGISVAAVREDGERAFITSLGSMSAFSEELVIRSWSQIEESNLVCLVGIFMLPNLGLDGAYSLLKRCRADGKITLLDTGWDPANFPDATREKLRDLLSQVTLFLPNLDEARAITQKESAEEAAGDLLDLGPELVVIKCGPEGSYASDGEQTCWVGVRPVTVFDAVGAGDNFNAGFIWALRGGWSLQACMAVGNTASSLYISRSTDRFPRLEEVLIAARGSYPFVPPQ